MDHGRNKKMAVDGIRGNPSTKLRTGKGPRIYSRKVLRLDKKKISILEKIAEPTRFTLKKAYIPIKFLKNKKLAKVAVVVLTVARENIVQIIINNFQEIFGWAGF